MSDPLDEKITLTHRELAKEIAKAIVEHERQKDKEKLEYDRWIDNMERR